MPNILETNLPQGENLTMVKEGTIQEDSGYIPIPLFDITSLLMGITIHSDSPFCKLSQSLFLLKGARIGDPLLQISYILDTTADQIDQTSHQHKRSTNQFLHLLESFFPLVICYNI